MKPIEENILQIIVICNDLFWKRPSEHRKKNTTPPRKWSYNELKVSVQKKSNQQSKETS